MKGGPCTECGQRMGVNDWTFVYGQPSRGVKASTGEVDHRPLGTRAVFACRSCELQAIRANLRELAIGLAAPLFAVAAGLLLYVLGLASKPDDAQHQLVVSIVMSALFAGWLGLAWVRNRPKFMREGFFLIHQRELASEHGLEAKELIAYAELTG